MAGIERLMRRNEARSQQGGPPAGGGVALPFILVQVSLLIGAVHLCSSPFVQQSICAAVHLCSSPFVQLSICAAVHLCSSPFVQQSICAAVHLCSSPFVQQSICAAIHLCSSPFVQQSAKLATRPQATVEVEISEDMQLVHFDFSTLKPPISLSHLSFFLFPPSTPFELQGDRQLCAACDGPLHSSPSSTEVP
ncbi:unnamed protein product, partial [Closterium sp. NIES-53]